MLLSVSRLHKKIVLKHKSENQAPEKLLVERAFGSANRTKLIGEYFRSAGTPSANEAWLHVYRLLLWIDRTTGLAHCYESDKSQPGRHWYGRTLSFHAWLAEQLGVSPSDVGKRIDWLFRMAVADFVKAMAVQKAAWIRQAMAQRAPYKGKSMPEPGEDPELVAIIKSALGSSIGKEPAPEAWRRLTEEIQVHFKQENKRRNLVGEGFEDLLAEIIAKIAGKRVAKTRVPIQEVPGFSAPSASDKEKKIDLVVLREAEPKRILATAKWSIRADREEQFASDFEAYVKLERKGELFDYVLVTNEFDPARLVAACERRAQNSHLFKHVVHINPSGLLAAYGSAPKRSAAKAAGYIEQGRIIGLGIWLNLLLGLPPS